MCTFARWKLIDVYSVFNVCFFLEKRPERIGIDPAI